MTPDTEARRGWAYALIGRCKTPPPRYGSPEFLALADGPEKVASVIVAAENWARDGDNLEENLRVQLEAERAAFKRLEDEEYLARRDAHRESWLPDAPGFRMSDLIAEEIEREWVDWQGGAA